MVLTNVSDSDFLYDVIIDNSFISKTRYEHDIIRDVNLAILEVSECSFFKVSFEKSEVIGSVFSKCKFKSCRFSESNLSGCSFHDCSFEDSTVFDCCILEDVEFRNCIMYDSTIVSNCNITNIEGLNDCAGAKVLEGVEKTNRIWPILGVVAPRKTAVHSTTTNTQVAKFTKSNTEQQSTFKYYKTIQDCAELEVSEPVKKVFY